MGSLHHVRGVPIDYDHALYNKIRDEVGGTDKSLFAEYYDEQLTMLQALHPPIVGHFDLIRLLSAEPNVKWTDVIEIWPKIERNLDFVVSYGGILEINTAAWRKGMQEPYPSSEICQVSRYEAEIQHTVTNSDARHSWNVEDGFVYQMTVTALLTWPPTLINCFHFSQEMGSCPSRTCHEAPNPAQVPSIHVFPNCL